MLKKKSLVFKQSPVEKFLKNPKKKNPVYKSLFEKISFKTHILEENGFQKNTDF